VGQAVEKKNAVAGQRNGTRVSQPRKKKKPGGGQVVGATGQKGCDKTEGPAAKKKKNHGRAPRGVA